MDTARCRCAHVDGVRQGRNLDCPIHGFSGGDPKVPYALTQTDKVMLRTMRIDPYDHGAIQELRQADENRYRRD
jgi:hypothetical protein